MQNPGLEKINYIAVGESIYRAVLANGLQVYLLPKNAQSLLDNERLALFHVKQP